MPVRYIEKVMTQNRNYLAKSYSALVKADKSYNPQTNAPFKQLLHPRKVEGQSHELKKGKDWTEISAELEYARGEVRREESEYYLRHLFSFCPQLIEINSASPDGCRR